jgi:hypothetical protein
MRVIGFMVCGPNEKYLKGTLDEFKRLCDDAVIATNNADKETIDLIKSYGYWTYEDNREWGVSQPLIKTDLLKKIGGLRPAVVVPLDADERFDGSYSRELLEEYSRRYPAIYFYIVNHWNDEDHHRKSLGFWNIRQFNYLPEYGLQYIRKNLHCGLGPPWAYHYGSYVPHFIHHYGLMEAEARKRKVQRYEKYDPSAKWKDRAYYEALKTETVGSSFSEREMLDKLREEVEKMGSQKKNMFQKHPNEKYVYVRRVADDKRLDMKESEWLEAQKTQPGKFIYLGYAEDPRTDHKEIAPPQTEQVYQCPLCGKELKTESTLQRHKKTHA